MTVGLREVLRQGAAAAGPARVALVGPKLELTHGDLFARVDALAAALTGAGVERGDRVVLAAPDSPDYVVGLLGILGAGGVALPVAADAGPARLRHMLADLRPRCSLVHRDVKPSVELPAVAGFALTERDVTVRVPRSLPEPDEREEPGIALILLSSGSTGRPKGVRLRDDGLAWTARTLADRFRFDVGHRELIVCPLVHSGAWQRVAATLLVGGTVVVPSGPVTVSGLLEDGESHGITGFYTPPPLVRYLLKADPSRLRAAFATLRSIEIGSAAVSAAELDALTDRLPGVQVFVHYGLTECSRAVVLDATAHPERRGTVGNPLPGVEVAVRDPDTGADLAAGAAGEIWLTGPQQAAGYAGRTQRTAATFVDGWVRTGDHGRVDAEGWLTFLGRRDDRITSAGFSFYPAEIEAELGAVEGVRDYLIAGIPDPRGVLGEVACAFVVPDEPEAWSAVQWAAAARRRLPAYMVPRKVVVVDALPRTPSGKSDRQRAVELFADGGAGE